MVKYLKILFIVLVIILGLAVFWPSSQANTVEDSYPFVYLFHLYYDNGQLLADRDFEFKYDLIAEPFVQSELSTATPYKGEVLSVSNNVIGNFQFDPTVTKGKIAIKGPYFSNAGKVNFYNDAGVLLLTLSVAESSVCNENGACDSDFGEDSNNCSADCRPSPLPTTSPVVGVGWLSDNLMFIIIGVVAVVVIWTVWIIIKRRKSGGSMPPTLPTPPQSPQSIK